MTTSNKIFEFINKWINKSEEDKNLLGDLGNPLIAINWISEKNIISTMLNLGDNDVLNLLEMLKQLHVLQISLLCLVLYYTILINIKDEHIDYYLPKLLGNSKYVLYFINILKKFKKTGLTLIIIMLILLIISQLLINNYFNFLVENFDGICNLYIKSSK